MQLLKERQDLLSRLDEVNMKQLKIEEQNRQVIDYLHKHQTVADEHLKRVE
jgi:hypothetical protein